ncbi:hypothetical protein RWE15_15670 [Virgibacillus halophilus]|uniref:Acetyltransferase (GNAT) family protein n=1 Tax=Tigheibacillus halophilus TaxID=361280 RepID=A0ABU5C8P2_9BACI|nr:hypothetical protein [Virgibacillus halophilus]
MLNFVKKQRDVIQLKVYKENAPAVGFYFNNGFVLKEELRDEQTRVFNGVE